MDLLEVIKFVLTGNPISIAEKLAIRKQVCFDKAIKSHLAWKRRLVDLIEGRQITSEDIADVGRTDRCELGCWIDGIGSRHFGELSSFQELRLRHVQFHELASQIVSLTHNGNSAQAHCLLDKEFNPVSQEIVAQLRHMQKVFA